VGALHPDKGIAPLLNAYSRLDSPPPLILAGRADAAGTWVLPAGAEMVGALPYDQVQSLYRSARAVVVPSVWGDPCPTVVLEAMAAGRPLVAAASGGIVDMVVDGETGYLTPAEDVGSLAAAMDAIISQPEQSVAMGHAGRDRVRRFTVGAVVERIEQMYDRAVATFGARNDDVKRLETLIIPAVSGRPHAAPAR
jgi:glycosyltransferase involved in cell wall biosynthesis